MKALIIDPQLAGCSGDMFLAALVDLTENFDSILILVDVINKTLGVEINISEGKQPNNGILSNYLKIDIKRDIQFHKATELLNGLKELINKLELSPKASELAVNIFQSIIEAESKVHGSSIDTLHLHETASVDTYLDILGTVMLLDKHELLNIPIYGLPANAGRSTIKIVHGEVTVPAPAVAEIVKHYNYMIFSDDIEGELLTPTGAAILANIVTKNITQLPPYRIIKIGYGAGTKILHNRANILRIMLVELADDPQKHYLSMLETHLDDVSGEILGNLVTELLEHGALDVSYYPLYMKKNRPGWCLRVICEEKSASSLAYHLMKESGTLGVREYRFGRYELQRKVVERKITIKGTEFTCRFKERYIREQILGVKPEFEDVKMIAKKTGLPIVEVNKILLNLYYS